MLAIAAIASQGLQENLQRKKKKVDNIAKTTKNTLLWLLKSIMLFKPVVFIKKKRIIAITI